jgi:hypothetical protein
MSKKMREIRTTKWMRMRRIKTAINDHPCSIKEILQLFKNVSRMTINNYLRELIGISDIVYDEDYRLYNLPERSKKREFQTKNDYDLALQHSRDLLFSKGAGSVQWYPIGFDNTSPWIAVTNIINGEDYPLKNYIRTGEMQYDRFSDFRQHLKTGYNDIFLLLSKVREKMKAHKQKNVEDWRTDRKIVDKHKKLTGEVVEIVQNVEYRIPLLGECKHCPHLKISILD